MATDLSLRSGNPSTAADRNGDQERKSSGQRAGLCCSDVLNGNQLQDWLEGFAERLKGRTNAVASEVQQVVDQMAGVELDLKNTFNSFRCLSSSQFVENRVYEEDETESFNSGTPKKDARQPSMPTESYEDEILPRYRDAVASAWAAFQEGSRHKDQASLRARLLRKRRHSDHYESSQILPHIIGTEDFTRDLHCGLSDLRWRHQTADDSESGSDVERDGADLAAELIGTGVLSEGEWSGTDSDVAGSQEGGLEPAVSAALDFKAMLEAALRNPFSQYDGGTSNDVDNTSGQFGEKDFSLLKSTVDNFHSSPRTMSRRLESNNDEFDDNTSEVSDATVNQNLQPPAGHRTALMSLRSTQVENAGEFSPLQPDEDNFHDPLAIEEVLKKPFINYQAQAMLNEEYKQRLNSREANRQVGISGLSHVPSFPGGLFDDEESGPAFANNKSAVVSATDTGPTIPDGLFQKQPSLGVLPRHRKTESESSSANSLDSSELKQHPRVSLTNTTEGLFNLDSDNLVKDFGRKGSDVSGFTPSSIPNRTNVYLARSISNSANVNSHTHQADLSKIHGGLFDDDNDEDEDAPELFGALGSKVEHKPVFQPRGSQGRKGAVDDVDNADTKQEDVPTWTPENEEGHSHEGQSKSDIFTFMSQHENQPRQAVTFLQRQPSDTVNSNMSPESTSLDLVASNDTENLESDGQNDDSRQSMQIQHPIQSMGAATVISAVNSVVDYKGDSGDSWSSSGSEDNNLDQENVDKKSNILQGHEPELLETKEGGEDASQGNKVGGIFQIKPVISADIGQLAPSLSSMQSASQAALYHQEENKGASSQTSHEALLVHLCTTRSLSASNAQVPDQTVIRLFDNPLLHSSKIDMPDADQSYSDSNGSQHKSKSIGLSQPLHNTFSHPLGPSELQTPPASQATGGLDSILTSSVETTVEANILMLEDVMEKSSSRGDTISQINEFGQLPIRRTFTSLFEDDDDDDDDLFGRDPPNPASGIGEAGLNDGGLSSETISTISPGRGNEVILKDTLPSKTHNLSPKVTHSSNPFMHHSFPSRPMHLESKDGDLPSPKPNLKLSSILFGDDDEDDEDALFGPLGGRSSRGSTLPKPAKTVSLFSDTNLPSTSSSHTSARSLFDD